MRAFVNLTYIDVIARAGSIRQAAEVLSITPSALNRRLLAVEDELEVQIFERLPRGVRLNAAGEILIHHIRSQISDFERVKSQIADLSGVRRGHVTIACSQALLTAFLPAQIALYRGEHPAVTFRVFPRDRMQAEGALSDFTAELALVFEPVRMVDFQTLIIVRQVVHAVMDRNHPLAGQPVLRLRDCLLHPLALPTATYGVRTLLDRAAARINQDAVPTLESDSFDFLCYATRGSDLIAFQIDIGLPPDDESGALVSRPIDPRDIADGMLHLGQLRSRVLSVATERFASQLSVSLADRYKVV
ncbi:MAG: LysR family transcriptional regulator [Alphaproteobacteria bacterium]